MSPGSRPSHGTFPARLPAKRRIPPRSTITSPNPKSIFPRSLTMVTLDRQHALSAGRGGRREPEVRVGRERRLPSCRRADEESKLEEEGLHNLCERLRFVVDGGGNSLEPHRTPPVLLDDGLQEASVEPVKTCQVHALAGERVVRRGGRHDPAALDLDVVPDTAQEAVGDARRPARAPRDGVGTLELDVCPEDGGRADDDGLELLERIKIEVVEDAETLAKR